MKFVVTTPRESPLSHQRDLPPRLVSRLPVVENRRKKTKTKRTLKLVHCLFCASLRYVAGFSLSLRTRTLSRSPSRVGNPSCYAAPSSVWFALASAFSRFSRGLPVAIRKASRPGSAPTQDPGSRRSRFSSPQSRTTTLEPTSDSDSETEAGGNSPPRNKRPRLLPANSPNDGPSGSSAFKH